MRACLLKTSTKREVGYQVCTRHTAVSKNNFGIGILGLSLLNGKIDADFTLCSKSESVQQRSYIIQRTQNWPDLFE
ncbi:hypothetical protein HAX54_003944, partial [Datura stramonium]|nr:hypothetical protein [Datura stramonium]